MGNASIKILVVDDDNDLRELIIDILLAKKFDVKEAENGKSAQSMIAIEDFHIVITDIKMPLLNGIELLHYVKRTKPKINVILMTGFSEVTETQEAYELGAREFLLKPFRKEDLLAAVEKCISFFRKQSAG